MQTNKRPPKMVKIADVTGRADNYQVSRTLPDLRAGQPEPLVGSQAPPKAGEQAPPSRFKRFKQNFSWKKFFKRSLLVILLLILAVGGWLGYKALKDSNKLGTSLFSIFDNSKLKGEDRGQINILLAGDSSDDPGHAGADLTDSIMLISINPKAKTAFLLSIPRDLYVAIPNQGYAKINAAYEYGNTQNFAASGYAKGGMGLLEQTVSKKFDIPIDYYALINYTAFKDAVNAVGGVTVNIQGLSKYGVYDPYTNLKLPNGLVQLDGQTALNLARSRGDGPGSYGIASDFDRTQHQRDILLALKLKATSVGVIGNPVKVGRLFDAAGNNVKTDLSLGNIRRLANLTKPIPNSSIKSVSLNNNDGKNLLTSYTTRNGQSALIPVAGLDDYSKIQALVAQLLRLPASAPTTKTTN